MLLAYKVLQQNPFPADIFQNARHLFSRTWAE
jgi:hypothetical protein